MRLPEIWAKCEMCDSECAGHPPEYVAWYSKKEQWLCSECWHDDNEPEEYIIGPPLAYASDALPDKEEQMQRLIAAATKKRLTK